MSRQSSRTPQVALSLLLLLNVIVYSHGLPPPMLRAVCGAFADAEEVVGNTAMAAGKAAVDIAMKPIAIVGGLKTAAVGAGMKLGGGAIKFVGEKMAKDGAVIEATGAGAKGVGLGVAAMAVKPAAEGILTASKEAEGKVQAAQAAAENFAKSVGDTSIQIDASIDSPIVGHHHKGVNVTAGLDTAFHSDTIQQQQQIEQHGFSKRAAKLDPQVMKAALNLIKEAKMEDCVARAICDLNCNPQGFGQDGKQVFMKMVQLQGSNVLSQNESKYYHEAASFGRTSSGKCDQCKSKYTKCTMESSDLLMLGSHITF